MISMKRKNPNVVKKILAQYNTDKEIAIGFPAGTEAVGVLYPDGTPVLDVAVWNNFGTRNIPRRDFMSSGGRRANEATVDLAADFVKAINAGSINEDQAFEQIGALAASELAQEIVDFDSPANAPSTVAKKGSSNPLVDTGLMFQSVTYSVRKK